MKDGTTDGPTPLIVHANDESDIREPLAWRLGMEGLRVTLAQDGVGGSPRI